MEGSSTLCPGFLFWSSARLSYLWVDMFLSGQCWNPLCTPSDGKHNVNERLLHTVSVTAQNARKREREKDVAIQAPAPRSPEREKESAGGGGGVTDPHRGGGTLWAVWDARVAGRGAFSEKEGERTAIEVDRGQAGEGTEGR